jgi:hypothetical protein
MTSAPTTRAASPAPPARAAPTRAAFIRRADAICVAGQRRVLGLPAPGANRLGGYLDHALAISRQTTGKLSRLRRPHARHRLLHRYLVGLSHEETRLEALAVAGRRADVASLRRAAPALTDGTPDQLAARYGLRQCAGVPGARVLATAALTRPASPGAVTTTTTTAPTTTPRPNAAPKPSRPGPQPAAPAVSPAG